VFSPVEGSVCQRFAEEFFALREETFEALHGGNERRPVLRGADQRVTSPTAPPKNFKPKSILAQTPPNVNTKAGLRSYAVCRTVVKRSKRAKNGLII
jgi:hypothetical protein